MKQNNIKHKICSTIFILFSLFLITEILYGFSHPTFATEPLIYRGDIKIPGQRVNNLALRYPIIIIDGKYYLPMTENFTKSIGLNIEPYTTISKSNEKTGISWSEAETIELYSNDLIEPLSENEFSVTVDIDAIKPLVTKVYVDGTLLRSSSPVYEINGIAYLCIDLTNDFQLSSTDILMRGIIPAEEITLPSKFNTFDTLAINNFIEDQGTTQNCWAYAALSMFEIKIAKDIGEIYNFSEEHLIKECPIPSNSASGGNWRGSASYFTRGIGPVTEKIYKRYTREYEMDEDKPPLKPNFLLKRYDEISGLNDIKKAIYQNGSVLTSMYYGPKRNNFYNAENYSYYCDDQDCQPTHELILVGWDDYFSKRNFNNTPTTTGAFIAMNSFGGSFGDNGLFYISYDDVLASKSAITIKEYEQTPNTLVISQDNTGVTHYESWPGKGDLYAILKLSDKNINNDKFSDRIRGIGVFAGGECIVTAYYSESKPYKKNKLVFLGETHFDKAGYKTIESYYNIPIKNEFYIVLKYSSAEKFVIPIEAPYPGIDYTIYSEPDTSFIAYEDIDKLKSTPLYDLKPNGTIVLRLIVE